MFYVGDRVKKANQLNGKSANLNYVLMNKIYPTVCSAQEIPEKDIFMVMDCDHMVGVFSLSLHILICLLYTSDAADE